MVLSEFVSRVIEDIIIGVKDVQIKAKDSGAIVVPYLKPTSSLSKDIAERNVAASRNVEFDVAVTVSEDVSKGVSAGVLISVIGLKGDTKSVAQNITESRVKFSVPVYLPVQQ